MFFGSKIFFFNEQEERDDHNYFPFGQGTINDFTRVEKEYLSCIIHGVCSHTESFTKICLQFWLNSAYSLTAIRFRREQKAPTP